MAGVASKIAVIGSGISGAVCASILAKHGASVTIFESARGPGGRMSQRRETSEDGRELLFDHGAPYFSVNASNFEVQSLVNDWEARGFVAEWKDKFGSFDFSSKEFVNIEEEGLSKRYVGVPGMNSICRALCHEPGVESRFGLGIGRLNWLGDDDTWSLMSFDGKDVGHFKGVVASDKNTFSPRFTNVTGKPPPIDLNLLSDVGLKTKEIPAFPRFALMLAFDQPLSSSGRVSAWALYSQFERELFSLKLDGGLPFEEFLHIFHYLMVQVPTKGFSFKNSKVLSWAFCDSSKPGRSTSSERWVLHSTAEYAEFIISQTGFQKLSNEVLTKVAEELFQEFQNTGLDISQPFFKKAHRWGSAFPAASVAGEEKCLWNGTKRLAICGDFCVGPNVEGAISSGTAAASKFVKVLSSTL